MRLRPHPSVAHLRAMLKNLPAKTGKSLDEWSDIAKATGEEDVNTATAKLKAEHGLGKPTAWLIASHGLKANMADYDEAAYLVKAPSMVDAQYEGKKAHLRPICDKLVSIVFYLIIQKFITVFFVYFYCINLLVGCQLFIGNGILPDRSNTRNKH